MSASNYQTLVEKFKGTVIDFAGEQTFVVSPDDYLASVEFIHSELGFEMLATLTAIDYGVQAEPRYHLFLRFNSIAGHDTFNLRVPVSGHNPKIHSIDKIYRNANWHEREVYDLFGVHFEESSDLRRIMMPFDWKGHPLRKDYPLGYEEPQFTFNFDEIEGHKPYAVRREE